MDNAEFVETMEQIVKGLVYQAKQHLAFVCGDGIASKQEVADKLYSKHLSHAEIRAYFTPYDPKFIDEQGIVKSSFAIELVSWFQGKHLRDIADCIIVKTNAEGIFDSYEIDAAKIMSEVMSYYNEGKHYYFD